MTQRILLVDDEESVQKLVRDYFESRGIAVSCASDGEEGLAAMHRDHPAVAIIDFLLPRKNGFAMAETIRANPRFAHLPMIMMSGVFKNPKISVEAREKYGVIEFLAKPIDLVRLEQLVRDALEGVGEDSGELDLALPDDDDELRLDLDDPASGAVYSPPDDDGLLDVQPVAAVLDGGGASWDGGSGLELDPDAGWSSPPSAPGRPAGRGASMPAPERRASMPSARPTNFSRVYRGRPFAELPEDGRLEDVPVALLISIARYDQLTGMLDTTAEGVHRRIYVRDGKPIFMQSNAEGENVGALLLSRGRITEPDFRRCLDYMRDQKRTMQRALLELRLASEQELATAYKLLAGRLLPAAVGMPSGTFKWRETDAFVGRVPEGSFEPVQIVFDGIKRHVGPPSILSFFVGREDVPLTRTEQFDELLPAFRRVFSQSNVAAQIDGHATYREIVRKRSRDQATVVPQLFALVTTGMTVLPEVNAANAMDVAVKQAAAEVAGIADGARMAAPAYAMDEQPTAAAEHGFTEQENLARANIRAGHAKIMAQNFFEVLSVPQSAKPDPAQLKDGYFKLAKVWHSDAFAGLNLGREDAQLKELFARVTEAYETLTNDQKRDEYMVFLDRKARGLPTDVATVLQAESTFDQGVAALRRRDLAGARRLIDEAIRMNPTEAIYHAYLGYVSFLQGGNTQAVLADATQIIKKAIEMQENLPIAYQFLGDMHAQRDQAKAAKQWFERCLQYDPKNVEALRGLRLIHSRSDKESKKNAGLLSRLLKK